MVYSGMVISPESARHESLDEVSPFHLLAADAKSNIPVHLLQVPPPTFELGFWRWVNCRLLIRCSVLLAASSSSCARSEMRSTAKHLDIQMSGDQCQTPPRFPSIQNKNINTRQDHFCDQSRARCWYGSLGSSSIGV